MSLQILQEMGAAQGLDTSEVQMMYQHGLTVGIADKSGDWGIDLSQILNLVRQFGPTFITILTVLVPLLKTPPAPAPAPTPEPTPAPTPAPTPTPGPTPAPAPTPPEAKSRGTPKT